MRLVNLLTLILVVTFSFTTLSTSLNAEVWETPNYLHANDLEKKFSTQKFATWNPNLDLKDYSNKSQAADWMLFDSLANAYTYFILMTNRSFTYAEDAESYILIKRGYWDQFRNPEMANDENSKNNLFLRISNDNCQNWEDPILVFDNNDADGEGRYPSVDGFLFNDELLTIFTAPLVNESASTWPAVASGINSESFGSISVSYNKTFTYDENGNEYEYSQDSRIIGAPVPGSDESFYSLEVAEIIPIVSGLDDNSNICLRRITDLDDPQVTIPDAWASNKFYTADRTDGRFNSVVDFKKSEAGNLYMGAYGGFVNLNEAEQMNRPGVSKSMDDGETWEDFNILPISVTTSYAESQGAVKLAFSWDTKDFELINDDQYSFILDCVLADAEDLIIGRQIVEVFFENSSWNIRKVADIAGHKIELADVTNSDGENYSPMDRELQSALTADGQNIIVKWLELTGVEDIGDNRITYRSSDIFIAARNINSGSWSPATNVTNDDILDRMTYMPDVVPSASEIPMIRMATAGATTLNDSLYASERYQHLYSAILDYGVVSVEDNEVPVDFNISNIYPNPVADKATLEYTLAEASEVKIQILNVFGVSVAEVYNGLSGVGMNTKTISTEGLASGSYFLSLTVNGYRQTKMFNVIK